ncbi:MAG: DUF2730 family protein [Parvibaculum sp.]|uniref:DUF2730 family protein n=1 Tax=Parvibaculum sp. TaxID=2024848 RepID=UPI00271A0157|nr:DUF2730 family protein [Parvibaculum sp.]MDO8838005.1 DUF2730 family protein [Parvibaculum sp.]
MEPGWVIAAVATINLVLAISSIVFTWYSNQNRAQRAEIQALEKLFADRDERRRKDIGEQRDRITKVEADVEHLPNKEHLGDVYESINGVGQKVAAMEATLNAVGAQVSRIDDYLRREKQ